MSLSMVVVGCLNAVAINWRSRSIGIRSLGYRISLLGACSAVCRIEE